MARKKRNERRVGMNEKERLRIKYLTRQLSKLQKEKTRTELLVELLQESLSVIKPPHYKLIRAKKCGYSPETVVALLSDAQVGTEVIGLEIGNKRWDYNVNVFRYRLRVYERALKEIVERHNKAYPIKDLVVWLGGDLLEGERIYSPQQVFIDTNVMNQFFIVQYEIADFLSRLSSRFEKIEVVCSPGNHGRVYSRKEASDFVNWEYILYRNIEFILREHKNIHFDIPYTWYRVKNVNGVKILFIHGDDIRRWMRWPWYGSENLYNGYYQLMSKIGQPFNVLVFGHFHQPANLVLPDGEFISNGSFVGYTRYTIKKLGGYSIPPRQVVFFIHPTVGITARYMIYLDIDYPELWKEIKKTSYEVNLPLRR